MQVILLENVARLGKIGDVVTIKNGFGRNYLIPQNKATRATKDNIKEFEGRREGLEKLDQERKKAAEKEAAKLAGLSVRLVRQASEAGRLYGSVSVRDIAVALEEQGHEIDRRLIDLNTAIKTVGAFEATILLHPEVRVPVKIEVAHSAESHLLREEVEGKPEEAEVVPAAEEAVSEEE